MDNFKDKVNKAAEFYDKSILGFDYKLAELNFRTLKPYFRGSLALELGPATGYMTQRLAKEFNQLHVVEGSRELLEKIPAYDNLTKHHSFFEDFDTTLQFDNIIMSHVLEHIEHPVRVLTRIRGWLKPAGVFLVSVPNAKSIHRLAAVEMGLLKSEYELNARDHELGHYRVYDSRSLSADLEAAGFKIVETGGIFFKPVSNAQIEQHWNNEMIEGFYKLGKRFPEFGAEIFAVATV